MGEAAKRSELKRAAQILGVTSTTLRQHGWKTASGARIQAATEDPPDWLIAARENQRKKRAKEQRRLAHQSTASRLSIQLRAVKERNVRSTDVEEMLAAHPGWLVAVAEQQRRQTQVEREAKDKLCGRATADAEVDAIDARWAPEVDRARREARRLVNQLTPEQARARIDREAQAATEAARHRATHLAQRAFRDDGGR